MFRTFNFTDPTSNPLHPKKASAFIHVCATTGRLSLTQEKAKATEFDELAAADLAFLRIKRIVTRIGVRQMLEPATPISDEAITAIAA